MWTLSREDVQTIFDHSLNLSHLGRRILEWNLAGLAERLMDNMTASASDRYLQLRDTHSDWLQRVPQYMIASYLGLTPEALSRVISRL